MTLIKRLLLFSLFFLISCAVNPVTGERELMLVNEEQEIKIGEEASPSLKWEFGGGYHDAALESYLSAIVNRIWQNSERPHLPVKFYIQNTSIPNAFALPGYVAITRGLLCDLENEAQFAAVIGHEVGHVMARHTAQRLSRVTIQQMGLAIGGIALEGNKGGDTLLTLGAIGSSLLLLKYDRSQEIQADRLGVKYMAMLGYNPNEATGAHKSLQVSVDNYLKRLGKSPREDDFMSGLLSTHPRAEVRLTEIQGMINELPPYNILGDGRFTDRFQSALRMIKEVNKVYFIYDEAVNHYQKGNYGLAEDALNRAIARDNIQAPFYNLLGFVKLQGKNFTEAEKLFKKVLTIDSEYQPSYYGLGLVHYFKEEYNPAINQFQKSLSLYPAHTGTHFGMGKSFFSLHRYKDALPYLRNFAGVQPNNPEVHGLLGICYENLGDLKSAVIEYRYQVRVAPDTELGRQARKRLAVLEPLVRQK